MLPGHPGAGSRGEGLAVSARLSLGSSDWQPLTWWAPDAAGTCSCSPSGYCLWAAPLDAPLPLLLGSHPAARTLQAPGGPVGFWARQNLVNSGLLSPAHLLQAGEGGPCRPPSPWGGAPLFLLQLPGRGGGTMRAPSGSGPRAQPDPGQLQSGEWGTMCCGGVEGVPRCPRGAQLLQNGWATAFFPFQSAHRHQHFHLDRVPLLLADTHTYYHHHHHHTQGSERPRNRPPQEKIRNPSFSSLTTPAPLNPAHQDYQVQES